MSSILPFDPPFFLQARRVPGFVDIPTEAKEAADEGSASCWDGKNASTDSSGGGGALFQDDDTAAAMPTQLRRMNTMNGNIIVLDLPEQKEPYAVWLHRKIGRTAANGAVRVGFILRSKYNDGGSSSSGAAGSCWELDTHEDGSPKMVAVKIFDAHIFADGAKEDDDGEKSASNLPIHKRNPMHELKAYEMIAQYSQDSKTDEPSHVVGTKLIGKIPNQHVYAILPFHRDGTLLSYCQECGTLSESVARFFFRRILKGLKTLRDLGLCHRNLSMESIVLDRDLVSIAGLGWCLRYSSEPAKNSSSSPSPLPVNSDPQYVPPEFFQVNKDEGKVTWDGYVADLWASALILFSMVVSSHALFAAPLKEDRLFVELCQTGNIKGQVERFSKATNQTIVLSSELEDLLQKMLKADPEERLTLDQVMDHDWLKGEETSPWGKQS